MTATVQFASSDDRSLPPSCLLPDGGFWLFGYGSIMWKMPYPYEEEAIGLVKDYARRFWQGSADHRGTVESPGRVCTVVRNKGESVWGKIFRISGTNAKSVLSLLDEREQGGYATASISVSLKNQDSPVTALMYESSPQGTNLFVGEDIAKSASIIAFARGPSGPNVEYLFNLNAALLSVDCSDVYCSSLEEQVRVLLEKK
eukprot:TRINITY_DN8154_c1_g2_i1.p1 TRINITY_DN8154_c1_g2~~TRINITY_DN8154_c1_g2_i1.p1  ORF type:complete len:218 (+),score=23.92 TRINITY_DN8154_c1_g2_i1:52-654(+)